MKNTDEEFRKVLEFHKEKISVIKQKIQDTKNSLNELELEKTQEINVMLSLIDDYCRKYDR